MKHAIFIFIFALYSFGSIVSLDKAGGGSGVYTNSVVLSSSPVVISGAGMAGIEIFAISDDSLEKKANLLTSINVKKVALDKTENYLYAACDNSGLFVIDISDSDNPSILTNITYTQGQTVDLFVDNTSDILAVANDTGGVEIFSISSPSSPSLVSTLLLNAGVSKVAVKGSFLAVGYQGGAVEIYDISSAGSPVKKYTFSNFSAISKMDFIGEEFVLLDQQSGIYIYDITHYDLPILESNFIIKNALGYGIDEEKFYISDSNGLLFILERNTDSQLILTGSAQLENYTTDIDFKNSHIVTSNMDKGIELLKNQESVCSAVVTYGKNPVTGNWSKFYSECDVPLGWEKSYSVPSPLSTTEKPALANSDIETLNPGWYLLGSSSRIDDFSIFENANSVWSYKDGSWYVYSSQESLVNKIRASSSYNELESIDAGLGFWIEIQ